MSVGTKHLTLEQRHELLMRTMAALAYVEQHDSLWWRTDGEYAPITLFVNCNDVFWWACADVEEITLENIHVLEKACVDAMQLPIDGFPSMYATDLFVSRVRGMRPQRPYLKQVPHAMRPLFEAAGPERDPTEEG